MRAVVYEAFGSRPSVVRVPDPAPHRDGVVIQVARTGLCRSDWHGWRGHDADIRLPHVPGHELAGTVVAVGAAVHNWRQGQRVTVPFCCGCGVCGSCLAGNQHICDAHFQAGFTHWGSFAELVAIRYADENLVALPDEVDDATGASLGCRFVTAWRAIRLQGRLQPQEWVAMHGCGGVGLSAVMIAAAAGAQVIAVDVQPEALALARTVGATAVIDASREADIPAAIHALSNGGAALSVDALGSAETCRNSLLCLAKRGRHVQVGLLPETDTPLPMHQVIARELELIGSHGLQAHRYPAMLAEIAAGKLTPARLLGQTIGLGAAPEALMAMNQGSPTGITLIDPAA